MRGIAMSILVVGASLIDTLSERHMSEGMQGFWASFLFVTFVVILVGK